LASAAGVARSQYHIATKVGRYGQDSFDFSAERVTRSVDESLARLNTEYIDVIQCHDIEYGDLRQIVSETLPALNKLKESGKVRYVGITGYPLKIFKEVLTSAHYQGSVSVDVVLSYCHYTLQNTRMQRELVPLLQQQHVGIINASPLAMGMLTNSGPPSWHPATSLIKDTCSKAANYCTERGVLLEKLAAQFSLSNTNIETTLIGTASVDELNKNVEWCNQLHSPGYSMDQTLLQGVQDILKPVLNHSWLIGRPENN